MTFNTTFAAASHSPGLQRLSGFCSTRSWIWAMSRKGEDPMSGLLSSVGGIDSSLFQRPQSMRDMRSNQVPPAQKDPTPSAPKPQQAAPSTQPTATPYGFAYKGSQPSTANQVSPRPGPASQSSSRAGFGSQSKESSNSQLDALLGGSVIAKKGRYTICRGPLLLQSGLRCVGPKGQMHEQVREVALNCANLQTYARGFQARRPKRPSLAAASATPAVRGSLASQRSHR